MSAPSWSHTLTSNLGDHDHRPQRWNLNPYDGHYNDIRNYPMRILGRKTLLPTPISLPLPHPKVLKTQPSGYNREKTLHPTRLPLPRPVMRQTNSNHTTRLPSAPNAISTKRVTTPKKQEYTPAGQNFTLL